MLLLMPRARFMNEIGVEITQHLVWENEGVYVLGSYAQ